MEKYIMAYLFVHFREMWTEKGEQVYFALSKNGYDWEIINDGNPVITAKKGDLGVRDIVIARTRDNRFVIVKKWIHVCWNFIPNFLNTLRIQSCKWDGKSIPKFFLKLCKHTFYSKYKYSFTFSSFYKFTY